MEGRVVQEVLKLVGAMGNLSQLAAACGLCGVAGAVLDRIGSRVTEICP